MTRIVEALEKKDCIRIGKADREGTLYSVIIPRDIPLVAKKIASLTPQDREEENYFTDPNKRQVIFEKDKWICQYCGEKVSPENATIDHYVPQSKGGKHNKENLRTS